MVVVQKRPAAFLQPLFTGKQEQVAVVKGVPGVGKFGLLADMVLQDCNCTVRE